MRYRGAFGIQAARLVLVVAAASAPLAAQLPKPANKAETDLVARGAKAWAELANFAVEKGAAKTAVAACAEAESYGLEAGELAKLKERCAKVEGDAEPPEVKNKERDVRQRVAALLDELRKRADADAPRAEALLIEALRVTPGDKKRCSALQGKAAAAVSAKDATVAARLLKRAPEADPDGVKAGKYAAAEEWLGKEDLLVVKASGHPMEAYVSLPKEWTSTGKTTWPVVVAFEGAGCGFVARAKELKKHGEKRPYIIVTPVSFSNANVLKASDYPSYDPALVAKFEALETRSDRIVWDMEGIALVLARVRERYRAEERVHLTGYSGGAFPTYRWLLLRPDEVIAAVPVSPNYSSDAANGAAAPSNGGPPVLVITGENDSAKERIFPQSDEAVAALKAAGFRDVVRRHLPKRGHESFPDLCLDFFDEVRRRPKK